MGKFNRAVGACAFCLVASQGFAQSANSQKAASASSAATAAESSRQGTTAARGPATGSPDDSAMRSAAARTRMLECGHQWSTMKKAGTAVGTWKEFSKICLTRK